MLTNLKLLLHQVSFVFVLIISTSLPALCQTPLANLSQAAVSDSVASMNNIATMPDFPGGEEKLVQYIKNNLTYPINSVRNGTAGLVNVRFVVDKDGTVKNPKVIRSLDKDCDEEALRVILAMPKWIPGKTKDGKSAAIYYSLPIVFKLTR